MIEQIKPRRLERGHRIGIVSPSYWMDDAQWVCAQSLFEQRGYELVPGQTQGLRDFRYAGSPEQRARDIMAMFRDPTIDAIVCARGGYGVNRVLPLLDFEDIRSHPKIFVGYSDITALLLSFAQNCGLTAFHGPMLSSCGRPCDEYNFQTLEAVLSGRGDIRIAGTPGCRPRVLRAGKATGQLWGGNLSLINERLGTRDQIDARGRILFIEEIGEKLHAFDRMLLHLRPAERSIRSPAWSWANWWRWTKAKRRLARARTTSCSMCLATWIFLSFPISPVATVIARPPCRWPTKRN